MIHTSTPSFASDVQVAQALKDANPALKIGFVGAKVAVQPEESLAQGAPIDFVARNEFDFTIKEIAEGRDWAAVDGISWRNAAGAIVHNKDRAMLEDMDQLPFVTEVYKRDLRIEDYFIGYLLHPYVSLYTGRGCKSRCTFCLWPQTVGGHRYRVRSPGHVAEEIRLAKSYFPQVREFFFDDDTFTDNLPRAEAIARELGKLGVTWSCNAKANVPRETLKVLKDNGLRLLLVGYESGNQQILYNIKKGMRIEVAKQFTQRLPRAGHQDPRHLHSRPARRDAGDDRGDDPLRHRDQSAHASRCRWRRRIRARSCTIRRWRTAGWMRDMPSWWMITASRSRRCIIRICRTRRSSTTWRRSIGGSISARRRSPRSWARWCAARR